MQRTPFYQHHLTLKGKMVDFFGWELPVQYSTITHEHQAVRSGAGLFDISHMGQVFVWGPGAGPFLQRLLTCDVRKSANGKGIYGHLLNDQGGVIDDLFVFGVEQDKFFLVINASRAEADLAWMKSHLIENDVALLEAPDKAALALQGPQAESLLEILAPQVAELGHHEIKEIPFGDVAALVSRTGYTGEDGFELFGPAGHMLPLMDQLLKAGLPKGLVPCGLGARDTLRTEAAYPLYGHELAENITPLEAGLKWALDFNKGDFIGREAILRQQQEGLKKKLVGFKIVGGGVARPGGKVLYSGRDVGQVTSGTFSPTFGQSIGMTFLPLELAKEGLEIKIQMGAREMSGVTCKLPFYKRAAILTGQPA